MANQTDNILILDETTGLDRTLDAANDALIITTPVTFQGPVVLDGEVTSVGQDELRVQDPHILLGDQYTGTAGRTAGFAAVRRHTGVTDTVASGGFVAGVAATSNPTVATTGASTFTAGRFVMITGANEEFNNGIYEVLSHSGNVLTIRGVGTTSTVEDFTESQFNTDTTVAGSIYEVEMEAIRFKSDGTALEVAAASNATPLTYSEIATASTLDLQTAYVNGNTITTDAGNGDLVFAGSETVQITSAGGLDVDTAADFDVATFDVQMTGTNGFSIDGTAASNVSVASGDLTLSTSTSGAVQIDGVDGVNINSTAGALNIGNDGNSGAINIGTGAAARTLTVGNATGATAVSVLVGTGGYTATLVDAVAEAWKITDGSTDYLTVDTSNDRLDVGGFVNFEATPGLVLTAANTIATGELLRIDANGEADLADANTGTTREAFAIGAAKASATATNPVEVYSVHGTLVPMLFASAPGAADNGKIVFLSNTAGQATLTPPTGSGIRYVLGILQGGDGLTTTPAVMFAPQFIARRV